MRGYGNEVKFEVGTDGRWTARVRGIQSLRMMKEKL
jgi:hypothetical protein